MFLFLALVYLFHGLQTLHAAPLTTVTDIFANTSEAVSSASGCICPADQRTIWDILWSSLATIFACSWVSVHPNIPGPNQPWWKILLRRLELMLWAVVGPELLIGWAFRQWSGARHLERMYKDRGWTKTHGHFAQMGGFMLYEGNVAKGVLDPAQLHKLLEAEKIRFPTITVEEIEDRSKADGFSKTIAVGQTLWFIVQCLARRAEHLDITLLELLTLSLAGLNGLMYFLWWHKPVDVRCPVRVELLGELDEPSAEAVNSRPTLFGILSTDQIWDYTVQTFAISSKFLSTLSTSIRDLSLLSVIVRALVLVPFLLVHLLLFRWYSLLQTNDFNTGDMKVPTFYSYGGGLRSLSLVFFVSVTGAVFGGIHCAGWFLIFPSSDEAKLWRLCSVGLTVTAFLLPLLFFLLRVTIFQNSVSPFVHSLFMFM